MLKDQFLGLLRNLDAASVATSPNLLWKTRLLGLLLNQVPFAAKLVGAMKVEISQSFIDDEELYETSLRVYSKQILAIWTHVQQMAIPNDDKVMFFVESCTGLSLTYSD